MMNDLELTESRLAEWVMQAHLERLRGTPQFVRTRPVTQKSTFDRLDPSRPLAGALRGHVAGLLWARLAAPFDERVADAQDEPHPEHARPEAPTGSMGALLRLVHTGPRRDALEALEVLSRAGGAVHEADHAREEARREIAKRLGLDAPEDAALPLQTSELARGAARFFEATHDLARSVVAHQQRGLGRDLDVVDVLLALRGSTVHGLPARLSHRWLRDVLGEFATPRLDPHAGEPLPRVLLRRLPMLLGVTSFARALAQLGAAVVVGAPLAAEEWVRHVDGAFLAPRRVATLFASLWTNPAFLARATDASEGERAAFARSVHVAALFEARTLAAQTMDAAWRAHGRDEIEARLFDRPLPRGAFGLLPRRSDAHATRFCVYLTHPQLHDAALDLFDEDWFRNPRSRSWAMLPPAPDVTLGVDGLVDQLIRRFEVACG